MSHRALGKQFETGLSWMDISERHPDYASDDGIHWAADVLSQNHESIDEAEPSIHESEPVYTKTEVPVSSVSNMASIPDVSHPRVQSAIAGYKSKGNVPPIVLSHKNGMFYVADGHHRLAAAKYLGLTHISAYVMNL